MKPPSSQLSIPLIFNTVYYRLIAFIWVKKREYGLGLALGKTVIYIIRSHAIKHQLNDMLKTLGTYIKLAVDIRRGILAGGGAMHADCEATLLEDGSQQEDVWGADWNPASQQVIFESLINIRPRQNNPSMKILDQTICDRVSEIVNQLLGDV
jgi:hypothetical protein